MASVQLRNVQKSYGPLDVVQNVSIDIADGEFVVLVGPSGCGKSTLLRMVAGLEAITGGDIAIGAKRVNDLPSKARNIAMVFQNYALYPHMTVAENMGFSLTLAGTGKGQIKKRVTEAADILGLDALLGRYPRELSGGQRQRVAMGRAIVRDPQVFLFDEPLSNLDAKLRVQMRAEIKALHQRLGTTTIYVTHDQVEAMTMADKIVVLRGGRIEQAGRPLDLYDRPANPFVASFIGSPSMNFLSGSVEGAAFLTDAGECLPVPPGCASAALYGVRPEHVAIDPTGPIAAEVLLVEPTGSETQVTFRATGDAARSEIVGLFRERTDLVPGARVRLRPDPANAHLFGADGSRLN
ncbi:ABC transporter ATP-binding protein [Aureimonas psammosilenae]|uniref:ABC transporter ATP-binding protein n=1 Tax=Aureimonas psammosilenae TaxID=2495496 RepID=UPI0012606CDF|nr:sn-glycerol-3-phosphate ABC transporter ATP-binding protein UgpC [Aureimonas psammosilenae]